MKAYIIKQGRIIKSIAIANPKLKVTIELNEEKGTRFNEIELPDSEFRSKAKIEKRLTELGANSDAPGNGKKKLQKARK